MTESKRALVVGLAKSGIPAVKALNKMGYAVDLNDLKAEEAFIEILPTLKGCYRETLFGQHPGEVSGYQLILVSPGVPMDLPFVKDAEKAGVEIIGELELGYRLAKGKFYAITGTNGKTTTTALTGEIFKAAGRHTLVAGNIGQSVVDAAEASTEETHWITEVSSFQLESIHSFHPKISAILNVTSDHLNRHKTMGNYIDAKCRIFDNASSGDIIILNADNPETLALKERAAGTGARTILFSRLREVEDGLYCDPNSGALVVKNAENGVREVITHKSEIFIPGSHNLENALAASAIAYFAGISKEVIQSVLKSFQGVEHRIEFVAQIDDVLYYNDSKGTNPDASIKAVEAMTRPTVLIAGGMDKGSTFDELIQAFDGRIVKLVVLGETAPLIEATAGRLGFNAVERVNNMEEAVRSAASSAPAGGAVLLSPACASWDMYENFEKRGEHFKRCVNELR
ncbi:UDP-N-acetylmuramoyl-L-alanine--D-glutamate ligase [Acidaminobacter hydrogenoformans]|uniref:UDP-N-acetylmuramoylalanine--D-glutamate ligase n=1 Tax=Acidaminobacter hydrogenoformans DSM 2784 TaxID=1120920 RepID=A0A1G5RSN7_9FIRM|nr:UDP-N-acetylmuramoyl-L-alanine--D-glutamate ligase [Acidaminobacter hydrogenoformans]SCZ77027.1 UDP-N-acetylmuramoylalanine--D-glutamate ligase [Acidaminobacter hydrogenoformans DSM 2784]